MSSEAFDKSRKQSVSLIVAEGLGTVVSLGTVSFMEDVLPAPTRWTKEWLRDTVIQPNLPRIERFLSTFNHAFKKPGEVEKSEHERADLLADRAIKMSAGIATGWGTAYLAQHYGNKWQGVPRKASDGLKTLAVDAVTHIGLGAVICSPQLAPIASKCENSAYTFCKPVFKSLGYDEKTAERKARDNSADFVINKIPDLGGLAMGIGHIWADNYKMLGRFGH